MKSAKFNLHLPVVQCKQETKLLMLLSYIFQACFSLAPDRATANQAALWLKTNPAYSDFPGFVVFQIWQTTFFGSLHNRMLKWPIKGHDTINLYRAERTVWHLCTMKIKLVRLT